MSKIIYIQIILILLSTNINIVLADCYTGFACSIADLEKKEQEKKNIETEFLKKYLDHKDLSESFLAQGKSLNQILIYEGNEIISNPSPSILSSQEYSATHIIYCKNFIKKNNYKEDIISFY